MIARNRDYPTEILNLKSKIEKLQKENQELKARCKAIPPLVIQNEKLTKAINDKLEYLENGVFLTDYAEIRGAIKILKELKEVLKNE